MGQILHGSAATTHAVRAAIQRSKAPLKELAARYGLNPKTVSKWRKRSFVHDAPMGPKSPRSSVLSAEEEAAVIAFRRHTLLPLDDCLYALQATIPHLTRSSLHRCFQRHGVSRLPEIAGDKSAKRPFKRYPIGYFHIDIAEVRTGEGKLHLFVVTKPGSTLDAELEKKIKNAVKTELSPRHVPDVIVAVSAIPRTLNGKKLEVPVKRILLGAPPEKVASKDTLANPEALDAFVALAKPKAP